MSKDQWIADVENTIERYFSGDIDLSGAVWELQDLGLLPDDIRRELDPEGEVPERYWKGVL